MLKIKFLFFAALILSCSIFAQNLWTSEVPINFTIQANTKVASFVDVNGIHIVYFRNGGIRYALVNSQGGIIKYDKVIEAEGSGADLVNVAVAGSNVYAVYYKNNFLQVARSSNLGDTWNNAFSNRPMTNTGCNKIVAYSDGSNLHITWSELRVGDYFYKDVHYVKFIPSNEQQPWQDYKRVSDIATQYTDGGENPDLVFYSGKTYVNYIGTFHSFPINRDRNINNTWNNPEEIPFNQFPLTNQVKDLKPLVVGNQLNTLYKSAWNGWDVSGVIISHSYKNVDGTSWTQNSSYLETDRIDMYTFYPHVAANTIDGKIHLIYWDKNQAKYSYRTLIGSTFSNHIAEIPIYKLSTSLSANSNDLYLIRSGNTSTPGNIYFRHYDAAPLAPQNLSIGANPGNGLVRLAWTANTEADLSLYEVWRKIDEEGTGWLKIGSTTNTYFIDSEMLYAPTGGLVHSHYKIKARDLTNHYSDYSNEVVSRTEPMNKKSVEEIVSNEYKLAQNYPNPFNPSTKISYSIKEEGLVTLKVFDILGKEIATLVNENKPEGNYEIEYNASDLPSGIYIYKIQSGSFMDVKKMLLTK